MKIAVVSSDNSISAMLTATGHTVMSRRPAEVPSLTALLFDSEEIGALIIQDTDVIQWSVAHVLAAAKHLLSSGPTILFGQGKLAEQCQDISFIRIASDKEELLRILRAKPTASDGGRAMPTFNAGTALPRPVNTAQSVAPKPMRIPAGKILMVGVVGSQHRIGCTTQAICLWHYMKSLGFDPAIVADAAQISEIASVMECKEIDAGYLIEGIPFVANAALAYDCYIMDLGIEAPREALNSADLLVLVAGSKPWELQHTAAAVRAISSIKKDAAVMLSYSSQKEAHSIQPLFGAIPTATAPWITDLWLPSAGLLLAYDVLLRSKVRKHLNAVELIEDLETDLELIKEEK